MLLLLVALARLLAAGAARERSRSDGRATQPSNGGSARILRAMSDILSDILLIGKAALWLRRRMRRKAHRMCALPLTDRL